MQKHNETNQTMKNPTIEPYFRVVPEKDYPPPIFPSKFDGWDQRARLALAPRGGPKLVRSVFVRKELQTSVMNRTNGLSA